MPSCFQVNAYGEVIELPPPVDQPSPVAPPLKSKAVVGRDGGSGGGGGDGGEGRGGGGEGGAGGVNMQMHCLREEHEPELPAPTTKRPCFVQSWQPGGVKSNVVCL